MGKWQPGELTEGFFLAALTPPTRLRRPTSPFVLRKNGEEIHG